MNTDHLLYKLFQACSDLPFRLADWPAPAAGTYNLRAEEVKETRFQLDGVLVPTADDPTLPVGFLEAQFQPDPNFYGLWFTELFLYLYRQPVQRPWRAIAIFPDRATDKGPAASFEALLQLPCVRRVYLEDLADTPTTHPLGFATLAVDHRAAAGRDSSSPGRPARLHLATRRPSNQDIPRSTRNHLGL